LTLQPGEHTVQVTTVQVNADVKALPSLFIRRSDDLTTLRSPDAEAIDYIVFAGPSSDEVISRYRKITGAAPLMPMWAYGYIHCRERFHSQKELLETADEFRERKLPMDAMVQDYLYWGRFGWNAMRFDENDYPDAATMVQQLSYIIPGTQWVDFFNPAAASLFWQDIKTKMLPLGIDAWWLDATEPENDDLHGRIVTGGRGDAVRLLYPLFVTRTVYEGLRKDAPDKRVFILTRSAFSGEQRYAAAVWSGDIGSGWDSLKRQIPACLIGPQTPGVSSVPGRLSTPILLIVSASCAGWSSRRSRHSCACMVGTQIPNSGATENKLRKYRATTWIFATVSSLTSTRERLRSQCMAQP
jgi:alpha-D-xyloside xylohydrolase